MFRITSLSFFVLNTKIWFGEIFEIISERNIDTDRIVAHGRMHFAIYINLSTYIIKSWCSVYHGTSTTKLRHTMPINDIDVDNINALKVD